MTRITTLLSLSVTLLPLTAHAQSRFAVPGENILRQVQVMGWQAPAQVPEPPRMRRDWREARPRMQRYESETFSFRSQAQAALDEYRRGLEQAGFTVIGGRTVERGSDYAFVIDFMGRGGGDRRGGSELARLESPTFDFRSQAQAALNEYKAGLARAGMAVVGGSVVERGSDYAFILDYIPQSRWQRLERYESGDFDFRSQAQASLNEYKTGLERAGFSVIGGMVLERGNDYCFLIDFVRARW